MPTVVKPGGRRPPNKDLSEDDNHIPDFSQTSIFHNISGIKRMPTSGLSNSAMVEARNSVRELVKGTESIGDLIEDGRTTLVFREMNIEFGQSDIVGHRFIIYQKPDSEGQIKIKSRTTENSITDLNDGEPLVFRQCTFFLCDTREIKNPNSSYLSVGIRIATEDKVRFIDCAFVGISYFATETKNSGVNFMVFTDCFSKINLELESCYFTGVKSVLHTNFAVRALTVNQCTFDGMESDCMQVTHPGKLVVTGCQFFHCQRQPLSVKLFDQEQQEKQTKKTSAFANSTKVDSSVVDLFDSRETLKQDLEKITKSRR